MTPASSPPALPVSAPSSAATVLVVDDTPANLGVVLDTLTAAGLRVRLAESGARALELAPRVRPDLVLLDVVMPELDGFATLARLRAPGGGGDALAADVPVIFLTAHDEPGQVERAFAAGAVDYVTKPAHPPEVLARVRTHLELRAARQALEARAAALAAEVELRLDVEAQLAGSVAHALLLVAPEGAVLFATRLAADLLAQHFPGTPPGRVPAVLDVPAGTLVDGELRVWRHATGAGGGAATVFRLEVERGPASPAVLLGLGLTPRQAEVLFWLAQGKANADIATIISASPRTVEKHVENIFERLGCESRAAAMATALPLLRAG